MKLAFVSRRQELQLNCQVCQLQRVLGESLSQTGCTDPIKDGYSHQKKSV